MTRITTLAVLFAAALCVGCSGDSSEADTAKANADISKPGETMPSKMVGADGPAGGAKPAGGPNAPATMSTNP